MAKRRQLRSPAPIPRQRRPKLKPRSQWTQYDHLFIQKNQQDNNQRKRDEEP